MREQLVAGRYRLDEPVGAGGMGVVWRATDVELGRVVALKRSQVGDNGQIRREARIGAGLHHPHVVTVFDAVLDGDDRWLVMEYLPSRSLSTILEAEGPLPPDDVARIGAQIAAALAAMHDVGMVHRDVKPGNILITDDGTAKLTDLGIARWSEVTHTGSAQLGGTPAYLAPEVADGHEARAPSDVFSLGATLFAAVVGNSPWGDGERGPHVQLRRAAEGELEPVDEAGPLGQVLIDLLRTAPSERPETRAAQRLLENVTGNVVESVPLSTPASLRGRLRERFILAYAIVVTVALITGLVTYLNREPEQGIAQTPNLLGDQRTADPCALIEVASVARFGEVVPDFEYGAFSQCGVRIRFGTAKEDYVPAWVELTGLPPEGQPPSYTLGRLGPVRRPVERNGLCERHIPLPDGREVRLVARHPGERHPDLCSIAEALASGALATLTGGQMPRRPAFPATSLGTRNACDLLDDDESLASVLGVRGIKPEPDFGYWTCYWEHPPLQASIFLSRARSQQDGDRGKLIKVGSRDAFVELETSGDGDDACEVTIVHRRYRKDDPSGDGMWEELANVTVETKEPTSSEKLCGMAIALSRSVVDRLP
ncbi:MAG: serine/threonine protein kinase [Actinomycetota bacterium]|nr:serine/threonine protein kinase [Actinomycetota bacterium]